MIVSLVVSLPYMIVRFEFVLFMASVFLGSVCANLIVVGHFKCFIIHHFLIFFVTQFVV